MTSRYINPRFWSRKAQSDLLLVVVKDLTPIGSSNNSIIKDLTPNALPPESHPYARVLTCFGGAKQPSCIITKEIVIEKKCILRLLIECVSEWNFLKAKADKTTWKLLLKQGKKALRKDSTSINAHLKRRQISRGRKKDYQQKDYQNMSRSVETKCKRC